MRRNKKKKRKNGGNPPKGMKQQRMSLLGTTYFLIFKSVSISLKLRFSFVVDNLIIISTNWILKGNSTFFTRDIPKCHKTAFNSLLDRQCVSTLFNHSLYRVNWLHVELMAFYSNIYWLYFIYESSAINLDLRPIIKPPTAAAEDRVSYDERNNIFPSTWDK